MTRTPVRARGTTLTARSWHCTHLDDADVDAPSHVHLAYRPGVPLVRGVWRAGEPCAGRPVLDG